MNVSNINEKPERKAEKGEAPDEKGDKKKKEFGKYFALGAALIATLGLAGCKALDSTGRSSLDFDSTTDTSGDNALEGVEDMDGSDVPEEIDAVTDVPEDIEMDSEEDVVSDVEEDVESEDVSEDTIADSSEDVVSEDVMGDTVDEDVSLDTSVDTVDDEVTDVSVEDVVSDDVTVSCDARDASRTETLYVGGTATVGGIDVRYDGPTTSGDGEYSILCGGVVVRSGIVVAIGFTHVEDVSEQSFSVELTPSTVTTFNSRVDIAVDAD